MFDSNKWYYHPLPSVQYFQRIAESNNKIIRNRIASYKQWYSEFPLHLLVFVLYFIRLETLIEGQ